MKQTILRYTAAIALGTLAGTAYAQQQPANLLLHDVSTQLGGTSSFVKWTNFSSQNPMREYSPQSTTVGTVDYIGGFAATGGLYSFRNDFATLATVSSQGAFKINTLVLQVAAMPNPDWSSHDFFNYNHAAYYQPGDVFGGTGDPNDPDGVTGYAYVDRLGQINQDFPDYTGGPLLKWVDGNNVAHYMQATAHGRIGDPIEMELGHANGLYYNFTWQWNLSVLPTDIISLEVITPLIVHSSTLGMQLTIGDTYNLVVPEPSTCAAIISLAGLGYLLVRRYRTSRKRS